MSKISKHQKVLSNCLNKIICPNLNFSLFKYKCPANKSVTLNKIMDVVLSRNNIGPPLIRVNENNDTTVIITLHISNIPFCVANDR